MKGYKPFIVTCGPPQFGGHFHVFQESLEVLINEEPIQCIGKKISFKELTEVGYELLEIDVDTGAADELDPLVGLTLSTTLALLNRMSPLTCMMKKVCAESFLSVL